MSAGAWPDPAQRLLLQAALLDGTPARDAWARWSAQTDLDTLDPGAHRLLPLLLHNLRRLGINHPMLGKLRGIHRQTWADNQLLLHRMGPHLTALATAGIPVMALKGAALLQGCYADFGLRPMQDLDLLVPPADADRAVALLLARGLRPKPGPVTLASQLSHSNGAALLDADDTELDLHWSLLPEAQAPNADAAVWADASEGALRGVPVRVPHRADLLLHVCVHGLAWNVVPPLRWVADAVMVLRATPDMDWARVCAEAEARGVALAMAQALDYLRGLGAAEVPSWVIGRLRAGDSLGARLALGVRTRTWKLPAPVYVGAGAVLRYQWWARGRGEAPTPVGFVRYARGKFDPATVYAAWQAREQEAGGSEHIS